MRRLLALTSLVVAVLFAAQSALAATPQKFIDTTNNEWSVAVEHGFRAWGVDRAGARYVYSLKVKPNGKSAYTVNPNNTNAHLGNIELDGPHGDLLAFEVGAQQGAGDYNVGFWDLQDKERLVVPKGVNTSASDEQYPSVSGDHLLFARGPHDKPFARKVILYTFSSKTFTTLATAPSGGDVVAGRLNGNFAVYSVCPNTGHCSVFRYKISTGKTTKLPNGGRAAYWPTVERDGTVYYVQGSPLHCGVHTQLRKWTSGNSSAKLYEFPTGIEIGEMYVDSTGSPDTLYFSRIKCGKAFHYGIWKIAI